MMNESWTWMTKLTSLQVKERNDHQQWDICHNDNWDLANTKWAFCDLKFWAVLEQPVAIQSVAQVFSPNAP